MSQIAEARPGCQRLTTFLGVISSMKRTTDDLPVPLSWSVLQAYTTLFGAAIPVLASTGIQNSHTFWITRYIHITFQNSVRTSEKTRCISITTVSFLMLFREILAAYSDNHRKPTNTVTGGGGDVSAAHVRTGGTQIYSYHWDQIHMQMVYNTRPIYKARA
jgi:hypothetical protein